MCFECPAQSWILDESDYRESGALRLGNDLDDDAIKALINCGLQDRFPEACDTWVQRNEDINRTLETRMKVQEAESMKRLTAEMPQLEKKFREAIIDAIVTTFPCVPFVYMAVTKKLIIMF